MTEEKKKTVTVAVKRHFTQSAERVFDAWLDASNVGKWLFATPGGKMVKVEVDARVGGKYLIVERRDGKDFEHSGEYLEIDRPRRLVFTFGDPFFIMTKVTIDIARSNSGCDLTLTHEGILVEYESDTIKGWTMILEGLSTTIGV